MYNCWEMSIHNTFRITFKDDIFKISDLLDSLYTKHFPRETHTGGLVNTLPRYCHSVGVGTHKRMLQCMLSTWHLVMRHSKALHLHVHTRARELSRGGRAWLMNLNVYKFF